MKLFDMLGFICLSRENGNPNPVIQRDSRFCGNNKTTFLIFENA